MPAPVRTPRTTWVDAALRSLAAGGPDAVRVEPLAKTLGVSKGGFYWHFRDRQALLHAMLDRWETLMVDQVIAQVEDKGGDGRERWRTLAALAADASAAMDVELAIREWARRDPEVQARLRRIDNRRMEYLRALYAPLVDDPQEVEARCMLAFALFVGNRFISADHELGTRADVLRWCARFLQP